MDSMNKNRKGKCIWLVVVLAGILILPVPVLGKYRSEFIKTVDIAVIPSINAAMPQTDGAVINDLRLSAPLSMTVKVGTPSQTATLSQLDVGTPSQTASPSQMATASENHNNTIN